MDEIQIFKNFNIGSEIDLAGTFAYNALSILNSTSDVYMDNQIFMFLYNAAVAVERMQKCVLYINEDYGSAEFSEFSESLKTHGHQELQCKIAELTGKKLSSEQNLLLLLLQEFYAKGRYSNYNLTNCFNCKARFQDFIINAYDPAMVNTNPINGKTYISEEAKERIGRTLGKLLHYYYQLIREKAYELHLYTYELRADSPAERIFLNNFPKYSLQAVNKTERNALAELIVYLLNSDDSTGFFNFLRNIKPLEFDPFLIQEYLVDIMNKQIPQSLVDEVENLYENMSFEEVTDRNERLTIIGERNIYFPEDDDDNDDDE